MSRRLKPRHDRNRIRGAQHQQHTERGYVTIKVNHGIDRLSQIALNRIVPPPFGFEDRLDQLADRAAAAGQLRH